MMTFKIDVVAVYNIIEYSTANQKEGLKIQNVME
jgi:hypothetical protein